MELAEENEQTDSSTVYVHTKTEEYSETICEVSNIPESNARVNAGSSSSAALRKPRPNVQKGVPHYGYRMRLHSRTGYNLAILPNGIVTTDKYTGNTATGVMEFSSAGLDEVRIRGVHANLYLAMNSKGNLYGEADPRDYATVFVQGIHGQYNTYLSQKYAHNGWYVGIKKSGMIKKGPDTKWGQKAIQFLPIREDH